MVDVQAIAMRRLLADRADTALGGQQLVILLGGQLVQPAQVACPALLPLLWDGDLSVVTVDAEPPVPAARPPVRVALR